MARLTSSPTTITVTGMPAWRKAMRALTWARVGTTLDSVNPENNAAVNPLQAGGASPWRNISPTFDGITGATEGFTAIVEDWSGAAFNTSTNELWVHGGGHNGYAGNELISIDVSSDSPKWVLQRPPTGAIGNTGKLADGLESTMSYFDGRPRSSHSYNNLVWAGSALYHIPAALFMDPTRENKGPHRLFKYTSDWSLVSTFPDSTIGLTYYGAICYDSKRGKLVYSTSMNRPLQSFNPDGSGFGTSAQYNGADGQQRLVYVPELDIVVVLCPAYANRFAVYDFGRTSTPGNIPTPPVSGKAPAGTSYTGEWVPSLRAIVAWSGGTGFDLLTPPATGNPATGTWQWSRLEASTENTVTPDPATPNGVYGRFFHSPQFNCLGVVCAVDKQVNVFALA